MKQYIPWATSIVTLYGMYVVSKKLWWGWLVGLVNQALWITFAVDENRRCGAVHLITRHRRLRLAETGNTKEHACDSHWEPVYSQAARAKSMWPRSGSVERRVT